MKKRQFSLEDFNTNLRSGQYNHLALFQQVDANGDRVLDLTELRAVLAEFWVPEYEIDLLLSRLDSDANDQVLIPQAFS